MRSSIDRRQPVTSRDDGFSSTTGDLSSVLHTISEQNQNEKPSITLPPVDASARSSAVAENISDDSKRKQISVSVAVPAIGQSSPMPPSQQPHPLKQHQVFSIESAQNIVSALIQMGFSPHDQETFTAVLADKVHLVMLRSLTSIASNCHMCCAHQLIRCALFCGPLSPLPKKFLPSILLARIRLWTMIRCTQISCCASAPI